MTTAILLAVLVLACIYGGYAYVKKLRAGGGCCGPHETAEKKVRVTDRDKSHYPYTALLGVDGMTCSNCKHLSCLFHNCLSFFLVSISLQASGKA